MGCEDAQVSALSLLTHCSSPLLISALINLINQKSSAPKKNLPMSPARLDAKGCQRLRPPSPLLGGATNGCLMSAELKFRCDASYFPCAPIPALRWSTSSRGRLTLRGSLA
jgi:hypothetical protein